MAEQLNSALGGGPSQLKEPSAAANLINKQASMRADNADDGLTMEEREDMAEKRFKAIAQRVYKREGWDRWDTDVDYIE